MSLPKASDLAPWRWVPTLYFTQGLPFVVITVVSVILYKDCGISNSEIAFWTSWLYLPWAIKGLWGPLVERFGTRRDWILLMQFLLGAGFGVIGLLLPLPFWFTATLILFWLLAFASATHDIAADGFYMDALDAHKQVWFTGIRNTFYRCAMVIGQGGLIMLVGWVNETTGPEPVPITISIANADSQVIDPFIALDSIRSDVAIVSNYQLFPEIHCEQTTHALSVSQHSDTANRTLLQWIDRWNETTQDSSAVDLQNDLANLQHMCETSDSRNANIKGSAQLLLVPYRLSMPPGDNEAIQTNIRLESGEPAVKLIAGDRHRFTADNWLKPAIAVFQYQSEKVVPSASATYVIRGGNSTLAWSASIFILCFVHLLFASYHLFALPQAAKSDAPNNKPAHPGFIQTFAEFFKLPGVGAALGFVLLYRFGEAQLMKMAPAFLMDPLSQGGLALTLGEVGLSQTIGTVCLLAGGILGSLVAARGGLKRWIWPMACAIHLPNLVYVYLAYAQPGDLHTVIGCIAIEQFGYGFGFAAFMLYMLCFVSKSPMRTAHYALLTGFMALGMMIPGMFSGDIQTAIGYPLFFIWILLSTIPGFLTILFLKIPADFGKRQVDA